MIRLWSTFGISSLLLVAACDDAEQVGDRAVGGGGGGGDSHATGGSTAVGSQTETGGASGGNSGAGGVTSSGTDHSGLPIAGIECQVATDYGITLPQRITFKIVNRGTVDVYLRNDCFPRVNLSACRDDYQKVLDFWMFCPNNLCDDPSSHSISCGTCDGGPVLVAAGQTVTYTWEGYEYGIGPGGCDQKTVSLEGKYRARVGVYATPELAQGDGLDQPYTVDFDYPDEDGIVTIEL
jgi:hypothetical protein